MKTMKLLLLLVLALTFWSCKSATEVTNSDTESVYEVMRILDTVQSKFVDIAQSTPGSSPKEVLVLTADWVKTEPNVKDAYWFDSTYIEIELQSGLRATFALDLVNAHGVSYTRGGDSKGRGLKLTPSSKNVITNKNVLIFAPHVDDNLLGDLYDSVGEIQKLANMIKDVGDDFTVTLAYADSANIRTVESFGSYGLVIISTHGLPDGFTTCHVIGLPDQFDATEAEVKETVNYQLGSGGYEKIRNGYFRFCLLENIEYILGWQNFLKKKGGSWRIMVNAKFINSLPPMPNTVILGNMCYSGWSRPGETTLPQRGKVKIVEPIHTAFLNKQLISYYSYGYGDGLSEPVDNNFAKRMEDSLIRALVVDEDSTGIAHLNGADQEYTASQLTLPQPPDNPNLPLKHFGHHDYSYKNCVSVFTDTRDGIIYKAVCIGKQTWMAENLRYKAPGSKCYDDNTSNCETYGRLYDWNTLMQGAAATAAKPSGVKGICPKGWHVPSHAEWLELIEASGGGPNGVDAGGALKSTDTLWKSPNKGATNSSGFSALPGGVYVTGSSSFQRLRENAMFWSATAWTLPEYRYDIRLHHSITTVVGSGVTPEDYESCRCVKD